MGVPYLRKWTAVRLLVWWERQHVSVKFMDPYRTAAGFARMQILGVRPGGRVAEYAVRCFDETLRIMEEVR